MKTAILFLCALLASPAFAQTLGNSNALGQSATGTAVISPGALTVNTLPNSPITAAAVDNNIHTNQAMSAAPAFGVQGIGCVKPGSGATVQLANFGAAAAIAGELDLGCDIPRDVNTMSMAPTQFTEEDKARRICDKPEIAKASKVCKRLAEAARAEAALAGEPVPTIAARRQPMPWQAGG